MIENITTLFHLAYVVLYMILLFKVLFFYKNFYCNDKIIMYITFTFLALCASIFSTVFNITSLKSIKDCFFVVFLMSFIPFQIYIYNTVDSSAQDNSTTYNTMAFQKKSKALWTLVYVFSSFTSFLVALYIPLFLIKIDTLFNINLHYLLSAIFLFIICVYCVCVMTNMKRNKQLYVKNFCYVISLFILMLIQYFRKSRVVYINDIIYIMSQIATLIALCFIVFQVKDCALFLEEKND